MVKTRTLRSGFWTCFFFPATLKRAVQVALVVGPILGLINHYDLCLGAPVTGERLAKIAITFLVPFSVSAYSSARALMAAMEAAAESVAEAEG